MNEKLSITFLGVGSAGNLDLGHASAVIEINGKRLLIDCGPGTTKAFRHLYGVLPDAVFITHCHLDHVGDFENLFIQSWFHRPERWQPKIYVPASIVPLLNERVGTYPSVLAEGGVNFWDAFHLVPVARNFIFNGLQYDVIPVRHHSPDSAFGLRVKDAFFYTGDTRPIPEVIEHTISPREIIFHDCSVVGNPSHTGIEDIKREYSPEWIERMYCYHYYSEEEAKKFEQSGLRVIKKGQTFTF